MAQPREDTRRMDGVGPEREQGEGLGARRDGLSAPSHTHPGPGRRHRHSTAGELRLSRQAAARSRRCGGPGLHQFPPGSERSCEKQCVSWLVFTRPELCRGSDIPAVLVSGGSAQRALREKFPPRPRPARLPGQPARCPLHATAAQRGRFCLTPRHEDGHARMGGALPRSPPCSMLSNGGWCPADV